MNEDFLWVGRLKIVGRIVFVSVSVSQCVRASTLVNSAGTAGPIGTGVPPIDAPIRRNDDGTESGVDRRTWHVARAAARRSPKSC